MKTANELRKIANESPIANEMADLEKEMIFRAENGFSTCTYMIENNLSCDQIEKIVKRLTLNKYRVEQERKRMHTGIDATWLTISWEE